jgi:CBS domain containing-hemolysin-like protein
MERFSIATIERRKSGARRNSLPGNPAPMHASGARISASALALAALAFAPSAQASFLPPEMMDSAAMYIAWFVIIFVPIGAIVLFWLVHIMPEKIAHKRHHPQRDAIQTLCLLSLVFGGLLWPIAWLWAYTRPAGYKLAYGTEKHEDYFHEMGEKAQSGALLEHELAHLRAELDLMAAKGTLDPKLRRLRTDLAAVPAAEVPARAAGTQEGSA